MDERTQEEIEQEAQDFFRAMSEGLIDNPDDDPPDIAKVGNNG